MRFRTVCLAVCCCVGTSLAQDSTPQPGKPTKPDKEPPLITRFYRLDELAGATASFPFTGRLPASSSNRSTLRPVAASGGMGGGGGMFNVGTVALPQGGGLGGGGMSFGVGESTGYDYADSDTVEQVIDLLQEFVAPDSWKNNGGKGVIVPMNGSLLIRASEDNHKQVRAFLNGLTDSVAGGQPLTVDAWWLPLNPGERKRLSEILSVNWSDAAASAQALSDLNELTESSGGHHGALKTRSGRTAHVTAGYRRPLVVGSVPNVGTGAIGHSPITQSVNYGIVMEIKPKLVSDWRVLGAATAKPNGNHVAFDIRTSLTGVGAKDEARGSVAPGEVDRYDMGAQVLEAAAVSTIDKPTVVGSLAAIGLPPVEGDDKNEIFVVVRVRR